MSLPARFGRYEVVELVGQGAMGRVYKARDPVIDRAVAVKVVQAHPGLGHDDLDELQARFQREFRSAGALSHPNIVTVFDVGQEDDLYYVAMEYVVGRTLDDMLAARRVLVPTTVVGLGTQLASALDYAHSRGVVHRDVKPANVLITEEGEAKVTDFGLAKLGGGSLTQTGTVVGTPAYMSPEQASGASITGASDQFSLASVLYRMLTGERPFTADTPSTILYKIVHETPVAPRRLNRTLPQAVDEVLLRALEKDPARRFSTCAALVEAVERALSPGRGETLVTGPGSGLAAAAGAPESARSHGTAAGRGATGGPGSLGVGESAGVESARPPGPVRRGSASARSGAPTRSATVQVLAAALVGLATLALVLALPSISDREVETAGDPGLPGASGAASPGARAGVAGPREGETAAGPGEGDTAADPPATGDPAAGEGSGAVGDAGPPAEPGRRDAAGPAGEDPAAAGESRTDESHEFSLLDRLGLGEPVRAFIGEGRIRLEGGIPVAVQIIRADPELDDRVPPGLRSRLQQLVRRLREALDELRDDRGRVPGTPMASTHHLELPPGHYELQVVQPRLHFRQLHEVSLRRGDEVRIPLPASGARVNLDSAPSGGRVSMINGIPVAGGRRRSMLSLPAELVLAAGENLVEIEWPGTSKVEVRIDVEREGQRILLRPGR